MPECHGELSNGSRTNRTPGPCSLPVVTHFLPVPRLEWGDELRPIGGYAAGFAGDTSETRVGDSNTAGGVAGAGRPRVGDSAGGEEDLGQGAVVGARRSYSPSR